MFGGDVDARPRRLQRRRERGASATAAIPPYRETRGYVQKVQAPARRARAGAPSPRLRGLLRAVDRPALAGAPRAKPAPRPPRARSSPPGPAPTTAGATSGGVTHVAEAPPAEGTVYSTCERSTSDARARSPAAPSTRACSSTHYNKGRELFEARRFEEAERQLEEAYLLRPRDPRVLNLLGLVYFRGEKLDKAEEVYRKLVAESPEAHTLHYNLGLICFKLDRLEDAESSFLKALELTQGNPKIHFYLGSIYERLHRYKDAIYQYRQAGATILVQRLEGRLGRDAGPTPRLPRRARRHRLAGRPAAPPAPEPATRRPRAPGRPARAPKLARRRRRPQAKTRAAGEPRPHGRGRLRCPGTPRPPASRLRRHPPAGPRTGPRVDDARRSGAPASAGRSPARSSARSRRA